MMFNRIITRVLGCCIALLFAAAVAPAQTTSVLTEGLDLPSKLEKGPGETLIVAENGTTDPNTGRISIVDQKTGDRRTLISGLPSGVNDLGGGEDVSGPSGLLLRGNTLYVTIGNGDSVLSGGGPGLESPNPTPSSALFNSVLELTLPGGFHVMPEGFELTMAGQDEIVNMGYTSLSNSFGRKLTVRLVSNLPDYIPNPLPDFPDNVKASNLYGVEIFRRSLYVVDAGLNRLHQVSLKRGEAETFVTFAPIANPLPFGPPFIEAVPDSVLRFGNTLLVTNLTGFPFVPGLSGVKAVGLKDASVSPFITDLTSAIDIAKALEGDVDEEAAGDGAVFYTLEFSVDQLGGAPGRIRYYSTPASEPVDVVTDLITPTSIEVNGRTGDVFVSEIFTGRIIRVSDIP